MDCSRESCAVLSASVELVNQAQPEGERDLIYTGGKWPETKYTKRRVVCGRKKKGTNEAAHISWADWKTNKGSGVARADFDNWPAGRARD